MTKKNVIDPKTLNEFNESLGKVRREGVPVDPELLEELVKIMVRARKLAPPPPPEPAVPLDAVTKDAYHRAAEGQPVNWPAIVVAFAEAAFSDQGK